MPTSEGAVGETSCSCSATPQAAHGVLRPACGGGLNLQCIYRWGVGVPPVGGADTSCSMLCAGYIPMLAAAEDVRAGARARAHGSQKLVLVPSCVCAAMYGTRRTGGAGARP